MKAVRRVLHADRLVQGEALLTECRERQNDHTACAQYILTPLTQLRVLCYVANPPVLEKAILPKLSLTESILSSYF
jgi:hypothetical protein